MRETRTSALPTLSFTSRSEARERATRFSSPRRILAVPAPSSVDLWVPVGNRDRSLCLVEKAVELGAPRPLRAVPARPVLEGRRRWLADAEGERVGEAGRGVQPSSGGTTILIGPEGGFTPGERTLCLGAGFDPVTLGPQTLRFETAALTALVCATRCG